MPGTTSTISLHLHYRLWIAELNSDINILRIFDDYLFELKKRREEPQVTMDINNFQKQFIEVRGEIDELKHEMHLVKMKMAEFARERKILDNKTYREDDHEGLEQRYVNFKKEFEKLKNEFSEFESKWL